MANHVPLPFYFANEATQRGGWAWLRTTHSRARTETWARWGLVRAVIAIYHCYILENLGSLPHVDTCGWLSLLIGKGPSLQSHLPLYTWNVKLSHPI